MQVEKGIPSVSIWAYFQVLFVLGLEKDVLKLADDDILGHKLQDAGLLVKKRAPKKTKIVSQYHLSKSACDEIAHAFEMSER